MKMRKKTNSIGIIGIRGLPAQYGAFDQHTENLISYSNKINDNKIYDMLGREVIDIKTGTIYIRNGKKFITFRQ